MSVPPQAADDAERPTNPRAAHDESIAELQQAIHDSEQLIAEATTVFPFALFPDTLAIDRAKITVTRRSFFRAAETVSFRVEDTLNAACTVGPFLGTVKMVGRVMSDSQAIDVGPFWRRDAARMKRIIQGYIIAIQEKIDTSQLSTKELAILLERLGLDEHQ